MASTKGKSKNITTRTSSQNGSKHVIRENGGWSVKKEGIQTAHYSTQAEAITAAKSAAGKNDDVIVHNKTGKSRKISTSPTDAKMMKIWESFHQAPTKKNGLPDA